MPTDFDSILLLVVTSAITFTVARLLSRNWRKKRREKQEAERRLNESRQVRRARERRTHKEKGAACAAPSLPKTSCCCQCAEGLSPPLSCWTRRLAPAACGLRESTGFNCSPYEFAVTARITGTRCSIDAVLVSFISLSTLVLPCVALPVCDSSARSIRKRAAAA
jgi:hypothetical protein